MSTAVSVIVPCYNGEAFLHEAVASVLAQTNSRTELVLVDDGSTDGTQALIEALIRAYPSHCIRTERQTNAGQAAARNRAIEIASGAYILPLDQDDIIAPDTLAECAAILDREPDIALVYPDREDFGDLNQVWETGGFALERLKYFNQISYCALYRKSMWAEIGGYRRNVSGFDDWDFWIAAALMGFRGRRLPGAYLKHRRRSDSQMAQVAPDYQRLFANIVLNNAAAYAPAEVAAARTLIETGQAQGLFRATQFVFSRRYWRTPRTPSPA